MTRPDERFTLASERTFLAWMRTGLGFIAAGVAATTFLPGFGTSWLRIVLGITLVIMGTSAAIVGFRRWRVVRDALETGSDMPSSIELWLLSASLGIVGVIAMIAIVVHAAVN